jgi:hypothetical protein
VGHACGVGDPSAWGNLPTPARVFRLFGGTIRVALESHQQTALAQKVHLSLTENTFNTYPATGDF